MPQEATTKDRYLDLMEWAIGAYTKEELRAELPPKGGLLLDTHWYSRAACVIGFLISKGRLVHYKPLWLDMMDALADDFPQRQHHIASDFALKEFTLCLMETRHLVEPERLNRWIEKLRTLDPNVLYQMTVSTVGVEKIRHNINVYNMLGDFLRTRLTGGSCEDYFAAHMPHQLANFTQEGMYMDPHCPLLYDLTTRVHFQGMLSYGYDGTYSQDIDDRLRSGGLCSLMMQTANGELAFGGRSNQFTFNDVLLAANFEFEAARYQREGNLRLAGQFKRAAHRALESAGAWINEQNKLHVKNRYPRQSKHGCEEYAYYAKYLITAGCFSIFAYIAADDSIRPCPCPSETGSHVFVSDPAFHKVFMAHEGKTTAIDLHPNFEYDAAGLGCYHEAGLPSAFVLSSPFCTDNGKYVNIIGYADKPVSICSGFITSSGERVYLSEQTVTSTDVRLVECNRRSTTVEIIWSFDPVDGCGTLRETYTLSDEGLRVRAVTPQGYRACFHVPYFISDGERTGALSVTGTSAQNRIQDRVVHYRCSCPLSQAALRIGNRNGEYGVLEAQSHEGQLSLLISLDDTPKP